MEIKLTKDQRRVVNAAAKRMDRPILRCVHIRKGLIEASDAYLLVQKKIDYEGDEKVLLDANEFRSLKDNKSLGGVVLISEEGNNVRILGEDTRIVTKQEGTFPNTDRFIPQEESVFKIALSRQLLKRLISALDDSDVPIRFYFYGVSSPVKIEIPSENTIAVLMPMFINWEEGK